jgi:RimJ/RimL family protein N-acetyltransferase
VTLKLDGGEGAVNLTTPRLHLREFVEEDWRAVIDYQSDARYLRYYTWTIRTEPDVRAFVQQFLDWQREEPRLGYQLALVLRSSGRLIGNCGLRLAEADARQAELGFEISPAYWSHGYATEAAQAMLGFGFQELGLHRIWGHCVADNVASWRVMEKLGMRCEGRLRENRWYKGRWWDSMLCAILEDEWRPKGTG